jgi:predicted RNA-binding protein with RPS1 domain
MSGYEAVLRIAKCGFGAIMSDHLKEHYKCYHDESTICNTVAMQILSLQSENRHLKLVIKEMEKTTKKQEELFVKEK